jgi:Prokaryotic membrane lipoprotein lipid attachment site.
MKKVIIPLLAALAVVAGCSKSNVDHSKDFTHTVVGGKAHRG